MPTMPRSWRRPATSCAASRNAVKDRLRDGDAGGLRGAGVRARRALPRPARGALGHPGDQGINPQGVEEADVFALHEQAGQFCIEVFFFRNFQNWGNRAYFPKADRTHDARRGARLLHRRSSTTTSRRRGWSCPVARVEDARAAGRRPVEPGRPPGRDRRPQPRRAQGPRRPRRSATPARPWPGASPTPPRRRSCWTPSRRPSGSSAAAADRGLRQLAYHGHERGRRHDRGRPRPAS